MILNRTQISIIRNNIHNTNYRQSPCNMATILQLQVRCVHMSKVLSKALKLHFSVPKGLFFKWKQFFNVGKGYRTRCFECRCEVKGI